MKWQEASDRSSTGFAVRTSKHGHTILRGMFGSAFMKTTNGRTMRARQRDIEGFDDWQPDEPEQSEVPSGRSAPEQGESPSPGSDQQPPGGTSGCSSASANTVLREDSTVPKNTAAVMDKSKKKKGKGKDKGKGKLRQQHLPGFVSQPIQELEAAAQDYLELRETHATATKNLTAAKQKLLKRMGKAKRKAYSSKRVSIEVTDGDPSVKVRRREGD